MASKLKLFFTLIRPYQYVKNLFIFFPLFFAGKIEDMGLLLRALTAAAAFSLTAGAIYILNDCRDVREDRLHPGKKHRPLASGAVSQKQAVALMVILAVPGISLMASLSIKPLWVLCMYIVLNIGYSFFLKHIAILDVAVIAFGFALRLFVGSTATGVPLSMWIVIMTYLLALFMALAKRRDDVLIYLTTGEKARKSIDGYNLKFVDAAMTIMVSVVIVAYILYTTSSPVILRYQGENLYGTALPVVLGMMRYLQITFVEKKSGSPTEIVLKDRFIQAAILAWIFSFAWIIYG